MVLFKRVCLQFFKIHENEFFLVQLFFLYIATITAAYTILSTTSITLFLSHLSAVQLKTLLPWLAISIAPTITIVATLYRRFLDKFARIQLITYTSIFFLLSFIVIRLLLYAFGSSNALLFFLMIWDETFSVIMIMVFFSYLGDYFRIQSARRLYGYIITGMALGAPIGGYVSAVLLHYINAANLIFLTMILLMISNVIAFIISKAPISHQLIDKHDYKKDRISIKDIFNNHYIILVFITVMMAALCSNIEVYQFLYMTGQTYNENKIGIFIGKLFGCIGIVQIIINLFVIRKSLEWFGVLTNLLLLPFLFIIFSLCFLIKPIFLFAATIKFVDATFSNSFYNVVSQMLYLPLPERVRVHSLAIATGFVNTASRFFAGMILITLSYFTIPIQYYSILILAPALIWVISIFALRNPYRKVLSEASNAEQGNISV